MEWLAVFAIVVLILGIVATSPIAPQVAAGLRCQVSRIFGSSSCHAAIPPLGGRATPGGATIHSRAGGLLVHVDVQGPPPAYELYVARLNAYCLSHPRQRMRPFQPGMRWIPCGAYDRAHRQMYGNRNAVQRCVRNVLTGAGLGATGGLVTAMKGGDVAASITDILEIVGRGTAAGAVSGGVAGAAIACLWGVVSG